MKNLYKTILLFLILHKTFVTSINITHASVPSPAIVGERGMLKCTWSLENGTLYSLKWYQGPREFYRWTPGDEIQTKTFDVKGLFIDIPRSIGGYVEFTTLNISAANNYKCEVSADAPSFHTDLRVEEMKVVDLPDSPRLTLDRLSYKMHENVSVGCKSRNALPRPKLNFFLNNEATDPKQVLRASYSDIKTGLSTTEANLMFMLKPFMVPNGKLKIKCTAEIDGLYWESSEIELPGDYAQYVFQRSKVSRNQSNLIINLIILILHLLQASLFIFSF